MATYLTTEARSAAARVAAHVSDAQTREVCLTALRCVGRLHWSNGSNPHFSQLLPGNRLNTGGIGVVCYVAPIAFALMAGAIGYQEASRYRQAVTSAEDANAEARRQLYDRVRRDVRTSRTGRSIRPGSMVFHGNVNSPIAHVTLGIGNGQVVSTWGAQYAGSEMCAAARGVFDRQVGELMDAGHSPDTLVLPATAFTDPGNPTSTLKYTRHAFWTHWLTAAGTPYAGAT